MGRSSINAGFSRQPSPSFLEGTPSDGPTRGMTPCAMPCPAAVEVAAGANAPAIMVLAAAPGSVSWG